MVLSDVRGWQYAISWDNPVPADSSAMLRELRQLGEVMKMKTKTSVLLRPKEDTTYHHVRAAISRNLHPAKGSAFYAYFPAQSAFQLNKEAGDGWRAMGDDE